MPLPTDAVMNGCVDGNNKCCLSSKCNVCLNEIAMLENLDKVLFGDKVLFTHPGKKSGKPVAAAAASGDGGGNTL